MQNSFGSHSHSAAPIIVSGTSPTGTVDTKSSKFILISESGMMDSDYRDYRAILQKNQGYQPPQNDEQYHPAHSHSNAQQLQQQPQLYAGSNVYSDHLQSPPSLQSTVPDHHSVQTIPHPQHNYDEIVRDGTIIRRHSIKIDGVEPIDFIKDNTEGCGHCLMGTKSVSSIAVCSPAFQNFIIGCILINAIMMGIETFPIVRENPQLLRTFQFFDMSFLILFTIELFMQFLHHGVRLFNDEWLTFDFLIIGASWVFSQMQIMRALRVLRALRLVTRLKDLQDIVSALLAVIPRMLTIVGLISLVYYIFAVMFTQLFGSAYEDGITDMDYFSRLDRTLFSLFQLMTLDSWSYVTRQLMVAYPWAWLPILTYILSTTFIVINLVIAVLCDAISQLNANKNSKTSGLEKDEFSKDAKDGGNGNHERNESNNDAKAAKAAIQQLEMKIDVLTRIIKELVLMQAETSSTTGTHYSINNDTKSSKQKYPHQNHSMPYDPPSYVFS